MINAAERRRSGCRRVQPVSRNTRVLRGEFVRFFVLVGFLWPLGGLRVLSILRFATCRDDLPLWTSELSDPAEEHSRI